MLNNRDTTTIIIIVFFISNDHYHQYNCHYNTMHVTIQVSPAGGDNEYVPIINL